MRLKDLKLNMILPKKEILIDKIVKIRGIDVHLVSITVEEHRNVLWIMYELPYNLDELSKLDKERKYDSNKDKMINDTSKEMSSYHFHISEMTIQKQKVNFSSSSASCMYGMNHTGYMQLQHFIESGMTTTNWDEVDLSNIVIAAYEQKEGEEFPEIDLSRELDITLKVDKEFKQVLINQPIRLEFGEMEKGKKLYFYDSIEKKDRIFYIDKMERYDIWEGLNERFENEHIKDLPREQVKQMKENYLEFLEKICPKGMDLTILEYETEDNIQLTFYSKKYLDKKPVQNTAGAAGMLFKSHNNPGINGFKSRICTITPVKKDFNGSIDAELFSWYLEIPEEIITV